MSTLDSIGIMGISYATSLSYKTIRWLKYKKQREINPDLGPLGSCDVEHLAVSFLTEYCKEHNEIFYRLDPTDQEILDDLDTI